MLSMLQHGAQIQWMQIRLEEQMLIMWQTWTSGQSMPQLAQQWYSRSKESRTKRRSDGDKSWLIRELQNNNSQTHINWGQSKFQIAATADTGYDTKQSHSRKRKFQITPTKHSTAPDNRRTENARKRENKFRASISMAKRKGRGACELRFGW